MKSSPLFVFYELTFGIVWEIFIGLNLLSGKRSLSSNGFLNNSLFFYSSFK